MRLTSLTLLGFKSFAEKARLEFVPGVNAIVGPNGSGKSNIVEALRWATGGGRAAAYRAEEKSELIFHGSEERRGVSFAEVALSLENASRRLHLSRSLYRDGQTKLTLNGRAARLVDVDEALAGSGLGRGSLAVIGQGEVGQVLVADPARLLGYVEEAAGVSKLSGRRERTQTSLEAAREHLERLDDFVGELRRQLERLSEEAAQAGRARTLGGRDLLLRYTLARRRVDALEEEVRALVLEREALKEALRSGGRALEETQVRWQRARARVAGEETSYRQALTEAEARRGDLRVAEERVAGLRERSASLAREAAASEHERLTLETVTPPPRPEFSLEDLREQAGRAQEALVQHEAWIKSLREELTQREKELAEHEQALSAYRARRSELEREAGEVAGRLAELEKEGQGELAALEEAHPGQEAHAKALGGELEALRQELAALQSEHATAHARAQALGQTASRARAAFEARRGFSEGPRQALTSRIPGITGAVADLIHAPRDYALALSSALGRRAENVVVDSAETAQTVIERLKRSGGRATLLPLDLIEDRKIARSPALEAERDFIGMLPDLVHFEDRYGAVVRQLLGNVALVRTLQDGVALAHRHKHRPRLVTLEGDVVESYGALSGGRAQSGTLQLINLRGEVEAGEREHGEAKARSDELGGRVREVQERFKNKGAQLEEAQGELRETGRRLAAVRAAEAVRVSLLGELLSRRERIDANLATLLAPHGGALEDGKGEVARLRAELERAEEVAAQRQQHHAQARERLAAYEERWRSYKEAERRFEEAQSRLAELRRRQEGLEEESRAAGERLEAALRDREAAQAALPSDLEGRHKAYQEATRASQEAELKLAELSRVQAARNAELEALALGLARREASLGLGREEAAAFPAGLEPLEGSLKSLRAELGEVQEELGRLGPVNYRAALEKEAQEARLVELTVQAEEAREAMSGLEGMLRSLDEEVTARLEGAVAEVKARFGLYCRQLFGGGEADIVILREEGRPSGLRITLQPPGKRTRSLNLLSVGERTMGALAFLFALIAKGEESGLSVAILDEVDAPLDEANIRRFCGFLESLAQNETQFILVTHQKATMEVADALWGVTTERGVSRIFSISKAHAVA